MKIFKFVFLPLVLFLVACPSTSTPSTNAAPVLTKPADQANIVGETVSLQLLATDADNDALSFSVLGLPDGLTASTAGLISGVVTTVGDFVVSATVSDAERNTDTKLFNWSVTAKSDPDPTDTTAPFLLQSQSLSNTSVELSFSEAVTNANNPTNYSIFFDVDKTLAVTAATVSNDGTKVTLTTASQEAISYAVLVSTSITDVAGNPFNRGGGNSLATSFIGTALPPLAPNDFVLSIAGYSAEEPKLLVGVADLELTNLEMLEYTLERFESSCSDAAVVARTAVIPSPSSAFTFDLPTTNYGAFKLSVTATYSAAAFQNPVKIIFAATNLPELSDLPLGDTRGLVFVELVDDFSGFTPQIVEGSDAKILSISARADPSFEGELSTVIGQFEGLDSTRFWCSSDGLEFTARAGNSSDFSGIGVASLSEGQRNGTEDITLSLGPIEGNDQKSLYVLYSVTVIQENFVPIDDSSGFDEFKTLETKAFVVMDCSSEEFPEGVTCDEFSDVSR